MTCPVPAEDLTHQPAQQSAHRSESNRRRNSEKPCGYRDYESEDDPDDQAH